MGRRIFDISDSESDSDCNSPVVKNTRLNLSTNGQEKSSKSLRGKGTAAHLSSSSNFASIATSSATTSTNFMTNEGLVSLTKAPEKQKRKAKSEVERVMDKAVIKPGFEKLDPTLLSTKSKQAEKRKRMAERAKTKGKDWFNMAAPEMTEETKKDLQVMQMRAILDPKRFYRKNDRQALPKYFQIGTVVEHATDFYNSRIPKKQRKQTIVDELLADADFQKMNKKRYSELQMTQLMSRKGGHRKQGYPKSKKKAMRDKKAGRK